MMLGFQMKGSNMFGSKARCTRANEHEIGKSVLVSLSCERVDSGLNST